MFKKLIIASAIVLVSSSTFAAAPYLGANIGVNHQMFKDELSLLGVTETFRFGGTGPLFGLAAGYGGLVNQNIYLGAELLANVTASNVDGVKVETSDEAAALKFKSKYTYGVSLIPGVMVSPNTMAYARLGVVQTRFDIKSEDSTSVTTSEDHMVTGGQFGLGLQTKVAQNLDLRGEYVYTAYKSFDGIMGSDRINASSGQATVGLVYKFE